MDLSFSEPRATAATLHEGIDEDADNDDLMFPPPAISNESVDSSLILQQHYEDLDIQREMEAKLWVFPETDVELHETHPKLLGSGTFGEVFIGKWRHVDISCKRLYQVKSQTISAKGHTGDLIGDMVASIKAQKDAALQTKVHLKELEVLTKLRHPNLVTFLGITHAMHDKTEPTMILTELMDYSLHELLEVKKVVPDVPEMLEILFDVMQGLGFLHSHYPPIIHGNLTSKNILFKGYTAKIGDFGITGQGLLTQFKPVVWTNSAGKTVVGAVMKDQEEAPQQWARAGKTPPRSPEAVAYLAPEVLNGTKYELCERMDIYSVGVLLLHMVNCTYPALELRAQHTEDLLTKQPVFKQLAQNLLQELPMERMDAQGVMNVLQKIMFNDRYYPLARRRPSPQSEVTIVARRWMGEEAKNENKMAIKRLRQMTELLKAEGSRWQQEGALGKYLQDQLEAANKELVETTEKYVAQSEKLANTEANLASTELDLRTFITLSEKKTKKILEERHHLAERVMDLDALYRETAQDNKDADAQIKLLSQHLATRDNSIINLTDKARATETERRHLVEKITQLEEENNELEDRLEQTLQRWKKETEISAECRADFVKLRTKCTTFMQKNEKLEGEKNTLSELVKEQESKVLPETVMNKIEQLEDDLVKATAAAEAILQQKEALQSQLTDMEASRDDYAEQLASTQQTLKEKKTIIVERDSQIVDMKAEAKQLDIENTAIVDELRVKDAVATTKISKLEDWIKSLEKGVIPEGYQVQNAAQPESNSKEEAKAVDPDFDEDEDILTTEETPSETDPKRKFHMADLAVSIKLTSERKQLLKAQNAGKAEKARQAAIKAADSMAKARVVAFERQEDGKGGGCFGIVNMLRDSVHDEHICWRACRSLRPIILNDKSDAQIMRNICIAGEVDMICVDIMKHHTGTAAIDALVQGQAIQLLGVMSFGQDLVRRRAGESGALVGIVSAIETHAAIDEKVLLHCLTSVTNLAHNSQDNRYRFLDAGGMDVLTDSMETYLKSPKVQRQGCWALLTLAGSDETARLVAQAGGSRALMTLIKALLQHPHDAGVQQFGLWALSNMALAGADISRRLKKAGAPEICRIAIENHPQDAEVIRQARHAAGVLGNSVNAPPPSPKKK